MKKSFSTGIAVLLLGTLACEPIFAVGWKEILFVIVLAAFLLGPPLYRFLRKLEKFHKLKDK